MIGLATSEELPNLDPDDAPLLAALGDRAEPAIWSDPEVDWSRYDAILIRSVWDYFVRYDEFLPWLDRIDGLNVWNPVETVRWNSEKGYLRELDVPTIPTAWEGEIPWDDAIVKPRVAGGSLGLRRAGRGERIGPGELAQPFLPEITDGELSLVFFDGQFSHAIRKTPAEGDIRVQPKHGGSVEGVQPGAEQLAAAERVIAAAGRDLLYARVDFVTSENLLIELEAIEPRFYFRYAPGAEQRLVEALLRRTG